MSSDLPPSYKFLSFDEPVTGWEFFLLLIVVAAALFLPNFLLESLVGVTAGEAAGAVGRPWLRLGGWALIAWNVWMFALAAALCMRATAGRSRVAAALLSQVFAPIQLFIFLLRSARSRFSRRGRDGGKKSG